MEGSMREALFLKHKIKNQLNRSGKVYVFKKLGEDKYHQPIEDRTIDILGLYHEQNSYITVSSGDSASVQRKKSPMILTLMDDSARLLSQGDITEINGVKYKVTGVLDVQNYEVVADISLEMEV